MLCFSLKVKLRAVKKQTKVKDMGKELQLVGDEYYEFVSQIVFDPVEELLTN